MDSAQSNQAIQASSFRCFPCGKSFSGQYELARHLNEAKAHRPAFHCPFPGCSTSNQRPSKVKLHFFDEHSSQLMLSHQLDRIRQTTSGSSYHISEPWETFKPLGSAQQHSFEYLNAGFQQPSMPENTSLLSNTGYESCGSSHQCLQPHDLVQGPQYAMSTSTSSPSSIPATSTYSNDWNMASATTFLLPSFTSPSSTYIGNSVARMAPPVTLPLSAWNHTPFAFQVQPTAAGDPHTLGTYPESYIKVQSAVSAGGELQTFYDKTMDGIEEPEASINTSLDQNWMV